MSLFIAPLPDCMILPYSPSHTFHLSVLRWKALAGGNITFELNSRQINREIGPDS